MMPQAVLLNYGARRRKISWGRWIFLLIVLAGTTVAYRNRQTLQHRAKLLYWQHACLNYSQPPQKLAAIKTVPGNDNDYRMEKYDWEPCILYPRCWENFQKEAGIST